MASLTKKTMTRRKIRDDKKRARRHKELRAKTRKTQCSCCCS